MAGLPLIVGQTGPKDEFYELRFWYGWDRYYLEHPFVPVDGTAVDVFAERMTSGLVAHVTYEIGKTTAFPDEATGEYEVHPMLVDGVEITLAYTSTPHVTAWFTLRPNGDFFQDIAELTVDAPPDGELTFRLVCLPDNFEIYANDALVHQMDPRGIDWDWVGYQREYWKYLEVSLPFDVIEPGTRVREDDGYIYFDSRTVPHIRQVSYALPSTGGTAFFRDYVKCYELGLKRSSGGGRQKHHQ